MQHQSLHGQSLGESGRRPGGFSCPAPVPALPGELFDNLDLSCGGRLPRPVVFADVAHR